MLSAAAALRGALAGSASSSAANNVQPRRPSAAKRIMTRNLNRLAGKAILSRGVAGRKWFAPRASSSGRKRLAPILAAMIRLEYRDVTMRFADPSGRALTAIEGVSFAVADGEVVSLIGPSGCGKSTLLNIGSGLYAPSSGEARVDGEVVQGPNRHVAFMLQKDLLLPWRTIAENVALGVEIQHQPKAECARRARELLGSLNLADFSHRYPHQLSGGMRQRV